MSPKFRLYGLTRHHDQHALLRAAGIVPITGDLDRRSTLDRLALSPFAVLHCAPPANVGDDDTRTRNLIAALASSRSLPRCLAYISTSGVYGDCSGARVTEARPARPASARGRRRMAAENRLRRWARGHRPSVARPRVAILRAPGIYSESRLPAARLSEGTPALRAEDDVHTNHIHAGDLARACVASIFFARPQRAYNISDDSEMKMGEWFDLVADRLQLPRPPRIARADAEMRIAPALLSFMRESRRLVNARAKRELRWTPRFATPAAMFDAMARVLPGVPDSG
jgi:nucleoside-diphosphate-sugar epimerase